MHDTIQMEYQLKKEQEIQIININKKYQQSIQKYELNENKLKNS